MKNNLRKQNITFSALHFFFSIIGMVWNKFGPPNMVLVPIDGELSIASTPGGTDHAPDESLGQVENSLSKNVHIISYRLIPPQESF